MCGIFFYIGEQDGIFDQFMKTKSRGPNASTVIIEDNMFMGFHRLMINDLTYNGNQPMICNDNILVCNGEIYNFKSLIAKYNLKCKSNSDCEVVVQLYNHFKTMSINCEEIVKKLCEELDGEFAFVIYDKLCKKIIVARDRYGVRPLFVGFKNGEIGLASELKNLDVLFDNVMQFLPSLFSIYNVNNLSDNVSVYYNNISEPYDELNTDEAALLPRIKEALCSSVQKRMMSDVPLCALLSGGLDSSLVCGILTNFIGKKNVLNTFSIGMEGSTDLFYAKKVADHIGSVHHEVLVTAEEMLAAIEEVVRIVESYDITTIRASTPHYLVSKYIKEKTEFRCVLSGEMSDEIGGSYRYFKNAPNPNEFHKECNRLLEDVCYFDNLRADRCISSQGLEARVPFSDTEFVKLMQSINPELRTCSDRIEKSMLRKAFAGMLPEDVLFRSKEALSDGVSKTERSWYTIIQEHIEGIVSDEEFLTGSKNYEGHCAPHTKEAYYYRKVFHGHYRNEKVVPYFWLPKAEWFSEKITDPSARTLA